MLFLRRKHFRTLVTGLIALMMLAAGPFAHASIAAAGAVEAPHVMAHHGAHGVHHQAAAEPAEASAQPHHASIDCCEDLGLCSVATAILAGSLAPSWAVPQDLHDRAAAQSLTGLFDPGLDLPPPRLS